MFNTNRKLNYYIFGLIVIFCVVERLLILTKLGFKYTDIDQMILWQTSIDMSKGLFYSPTFYGQSYGPNIEPLFSIPLILCGLPPKFVLPIITSLLVFASFTLFSWVFYKQKGILWASIPWLILLALPAHFTMITVLTRGWVGVLFVFSLSFYLYHQNHYKIAAFFFTFSLWFNPLILVISPFFLWFTEWNWQNIKKMIPFFIIGFIPQFFSYLFFLNHQDYIIHKAPGTQASIKYFIENVKNWDILFFRNITPYLWKNTQYFMLIIPIASLFLKKYNNKAAFIFIISFVGLVSISFFENIVTASVYLNGSRYYLFYPFIWFFIFGILFTWKVKLFYVFLLYSCVLFTYKTINCNQLINKAVQEPFYIVKPNYIDERLSMCQAIDVINPEIVIGMGINHTEYSILYGCPILVKNNIKYIDFNYDRRVFLKDDILNNSYSKILLQANNKNVFEKYNFSSFAKAELIQGNNQMLLYSNKPMTGYQIFKVIFNK